MYLPLYLYMYICHSVIGVSVSESTWDKTKNLSGRKWKFVAHHLWWILLGDFCPSNISLSTWYQQDNQTLAQKEEIRKR